jgi:hypothetical protein
LYHKDAGITTVNTRLQMVCTFIYTNCKYTTCFMRSLRRNSWCYWSAVHCDDRATVAEVDWRLCCLEDCREFLLFTGARSMGRVVQWSPMKPESWSGWFPLKSSPLYFCRWLDCDLQNVPCETANCTARTQRANWSESSSWLRSSKLLKRLPRIILLMSWSGPKCRHCSQQFMYCCDCLLPWKFCLSGCCLDTDLPNRYLGSDMVTRGRFP